MASDLFKKQGEPPYIADLKYKVHDILPGTERSMDLGSWGGVVGEMEEVVEVEEEVMVEIVE